MRILCNREPNNDRCNVELGKLYVGYSSVESFIADVKKRHFILEETGVLYHEDDREERIEHWKLNGHEVHYPVNKSRYDAVVVLFYEPVLITATVAS